jgi:hypothetical protein
VNLEKSKEMLLQRQVHLNVAMISEKDEDHKKEQKKKQNMDFKKLDKAIQDFYKKSGLKAE